MRYFALIIPVLLCFSAMAQNERRHIREGNDNYADGNYNNSIVAYQKALTENPTSFEAAFNMGDALFKDKKYEDAVSQFESLAAQAKTPDQKALVYHNLGNSQLMQGKLNESIEAYKSALRNNPTNQDTRYNLSYALQLLKEQQKQQQQQQKNDDQNQDQQNQDQQNKDQQDKDQQNKDKKKDNKQDGDKNKQSEENKDENKDGEPKGQQQAVKISEEDANRLLEMLKNQEQKVQEKVKKDKANAKRVNVDKDW